MAGPVLVQCPEPWEAGRGGAKGQSGTSSCIWLLALQGERALLRALLLVFCIDVKCGNQKLGFLP